MRTRYKKELVATAILALTVSSLVAVTDTQVFTVTVPSVLTISGPSDVTIAHDGTDSNNAFSAQQYSVSQNPISGSSVTFDVSAPFTHTTASSFKRDCKLDLAIASSEAVALWAVSTASDQTDYGSSDNAAQVAAASQLPGDVVFNLTVTFITSDYSTLAAGSYSTTVTATLTSN
jgi:hypothetical protein